jgi:hypothetical protein
VASSACNIGVLNIRQGINSMTYRVYIAAQGSPKPFAYYDAANKAQANTRAVALRDKHKGKGITITVEGSNNG